MPLVFLVDILLLAFLSSIFGLGCFLFGLPFWGGFALAFVSLFVIGLIFNGIYISRINGKIAKMNNDTAKMVSEQEITLSCAYCRSPNSVLLAKHSMDFTCAQCKNKNRVLQSFTTVQISTPIDNISETSVNELISDAELDKIEPEE